jgi:hypothetical protein
MHMAGGGMHRGGGGGGMHVHPVHPPWVHPCVFLNTDFWGLKAHSHQPIPVLINSVSERRIKIIVSFVFRASIPYIDQSPQEAIPPDYKLQYADNR